VFVIFA